jgi:hypothetical protein
VPDLKPMEFGEVLDGALSLFRRHFGIFFKLSLAVMWLPIAVMVYWRFRFFSFQGAQTPDQVLAALQNEIMPIILSTTVLLVVYGCGILLLTAGSIRVISDSYLGREPQFGEALALGARKIVPLFLVGLGKRLLLILVGLVSFFVVVMLSVLAKLAGQGVVVLLVLGGTCGVVWLLFFIASGYMVTTPVVVLEPLPSAFDSFGRSWELTRGAKLRMLGLWIVGLIITSILPALVMQAVGGMILELLPGAFFQGAWTIVSGLLSVMLAPVMPCILTLAYYDRRVRREGFDLQLLSEQLETL